MRQVVYAMRFAGSAIPTGADGSLLKTATTGPSLPLPGGIPIGDLAVDPEPGIGAEATLETELTFTSATSFQETGSISFGGGHRLRFATVGNGYLEPGPDNEHRQGAVTWRVTGGEGQFARAHGLITSNLVLAGDLKLTGYHLGVLFLP